jgi:hypothetical protein
MWVEGNEMKFIVTLEVTPETGTELAVYLTRAVQNVLFNIGPEPLRFTKGSIYSDDQATARVGTWEISDGARPESEMVEAIARAIHQVWCEEPYGENAVLQAEARAEARSAIAVINGV